MLFNLCRLSALEDNILSYRIRKSKFRHKENARNDIPNHFCLINTSDRTSGYYILYFSYSYLILY